MARGFAESGAVSPSSMRVSRSSDAARAARWTNLGVEALASNGDVARVSDVVVLAVKPHVLPGVLDRDRVPRLAGDVALVRRRGREHVVHRARGVGREGRRGIEG